MFGDSAVWPVIVGSALYCNNALLRNGHIFALGQACNAIRFPLFSIMIIVEPFCSIILPGVELNCASSLFLFCLTMTLSPTLKCDGFDFRFTLALRF